MLASPLNALRQKMWAESRTILAKTLSIGHANLVSLWSYSGLRDYRGCPISARFPLLPPWPTSWGGDRKVGVTGLEKKARRKDSGASKAFSLIRLYLEVKRLNSLTQRVFLIRSLLMSKKISDKTKVKMYYIPPHYAKTSIHLPSFISIEKISLKEL